MEQKLGNNSKEKALKAQIAELEQKLKEQSQLVVEASELEEKLKKQEAEHQVAVNNLRAEISELKSQKQDKQKTAVVPEQEIETPPENMVAEALFLCYQQARLMTKMLEKAQDSNLAAQVSELELKIEAQSKVTNEFGELQRKVEEQSKLATKVAELQRKIEQQSCLEGRILKLERQNHKNNLGARVSELEQKVEELSNLTTQVSNLERQSEARSNVNELSLLQLTETINDLQIRSEEQSRRIKSVVGKKGLKEVNKNEPVNACYYHLRFGANAHKCVEPCSYVEDFLCDPDSE